MKYINQFSNYYIYQYNMYQFDHTCTDTKSVISPPLPDPPLPPDTVVLFTPEPPPPPPPDPDNVPDNPGKPLPLLLPEIQETLFQISPVQS